MAATLFAGAIAATAADAPPGVQVVKPGLYRIAEGAGSTLLRTSPDGVIVVDARGAGTVDHLMAQIERLAKTASPRVRALVLTGSGRDQAASAARFVDAGIPLIVQKRALAGLRDEALDKRAAASQPRVVVTYDTDYRLTAAGVVVEIEHVGSGHSGADSVVLFPDLRVVAVGDLFTSGTPEPDCASGGSFAGWAAAIAHLLWSDFDVAVPSRGPAVGKRELVAFKAKLEALAQRDAGANGAGCGVAADVPRGEGAGK